MGKARRRQSGKGKLEVSSWGPGILIVLYWAVMLSTMGESTSWALHNQPALQPIVWFVVAIATGLIVRWIFPGRRSGETLTIVVLGVAALVAYLQWKKPTKLFVPVSALGLRQAK